MSSKKRFVAYFRVSTDRQGQSGLGLEAQRNAVINYLNGGSWTLLDEFVEVESGKRDDRPKLAKAMLLCQRTRSTLVIAKLDRLARNVAFIANLMDSGVDFIAVDSPHASRLTLHILAAVAENEREMISQRTKSALAAARARGVKLGKNNLTEEGQRLGAVNGSQKRIKQADTFARQFVPVIDDIKNSGVNSLRGIARELSARGIPTATDAMWHPATVRNLINRSVSQ